MTKFIVMEEINIELGDGEKGLEVHNIVGICDTEAEAKKIKSKCEANVDTDEIYEQYEKEYKDEISGDVEVDYIIYTFNGKPLETFEGVVDYE